MSNVQINNLIIQIQRQLIKIIIIEKMGHIIVVLAVEEVGCRHLVVEQVTVPNKKVKFDSMKNNF